jgi:hypothetical protein
VVSQRKDKIMSRRLDEKGRVNKVLLREVEYCGECGKMFLSLIPLKKCVDHEDLEQI